MKPEELREWMRSVVFGDDTSTDEQLMDDFISAGCDLESAKNVVASRNPRVVCTGCQNSDHVRPFCGAPFCDSCIAELSPLGDTLDEVTASINLLQRSKPS